MDRQYKTSYMLSENKEKKSSFAFIPQVKKSGKYEVFLYCTQIANMPSSMDVEVTGADGISRVTVSPKEHAGEWIKIGLYQFDTDSQSKIKIDGSNTDGPIFADAVILRPKQ